MYRRLLYLVFRVDTKMQCYGVQTRSAKIDGSEGGVRELGRREKLPGAAPSGEPGVFTAQAPRWGPLCCQRVFTFAGTTCDG